MTDGEFLDRGEVTRRRDWTLDWFGERCDDYDPDCPVCRQWRLQDEWEKSISLKESPVEGFYRYEATPEETGVSVYPIDFARFMAEMSKRGETVQSPDDEESPDGV